MKVWCFLTIKADFVENPSLSSNGIVEKMYLEFMCHQTDKVRKESLITSAL